MKNYRFLFCCLVGLLLSVPGWSTPEFSTAGFFELPQTGREVYSMNLAWRFFKGKPQGEPSRPDYDDADWEVVSVPHGLEYVPVEASGCANYQGEAWYRKRFTPAAGLQGRRVFLHFEGIMGKSRVYLNGELVKEHFGGYLPVIVDVTGRLRPGRENVLAVMADNSDDPNFPVGKPQAQLDFTYFGGIYRDCWLVAHGDVFITDANYENEVAGGGLFVSYSDVSDAGADVRLQAHVRNASDRSRRVSVEFELKDRDGNRVAVAAGNLRLKSGQARHTVSTIHVHQPRLWSPDDPHLYDLLVYVKEDGRVIDGYRQRIGIRSIEFRKTDGLWINGRRYEGKIMGTNRHQDFAVLGGAMPNALQWRDAKKLRDAGLKVVRTHYVIDPAFMDACDELGLFALVEVPGWQFWNKAPVFSQHLYRDLRDMVRIHRNHASLFFWEPILNETHYPDEFAKNARKICDEEYPHPYSIAACDDGANGDEYFDLLLRPIESKLRTDKTYFIREWGDNVDDWNAQNSDSRVARSWGEVPMLVQAAHYGMPYYLDRHPIHCYDEICRKPSQIVGACFWHSFDHQRGYHADPFYGGIMDAFRQPKTSYYMFMSQRPPQSSDRLQAETGPMVYIAHELTPFSPADVTVYSNCDEVRLTVWKGGKVYTYRKDPQREGMPSPIITFKDVYHYMDWKNLIRSGRRGDAYLLAEGLMDGKVVATCMRRPAGQAHQLRLRLDDEGTGLKADGSDVVAVVAEMVDRQGNVKRLNNSWIRFRVEGEGRLLGDGVTGVNPQQIEWGSAVALIQASHRSGRIRVVASMEVPGRARPLEGTLDFESRPSAQREIYSEAEWACRKQSVAASAPESRSSSELERENARLRKELQQLKVKEVEQQQTQFGVGIND